MDDSAIYSMGVNVKEVITIDTFPFCDAGAKQFETCVHAPISSCRAIHFNVIVLWALGWLGIGTGCQSAGLTTQHQAGPRHVGEEVYQSAQAKAEGIVRD